MKLAQKIFYLLCLLSATTLTNANSANQKNDYQIRYSSQVDTLYKQLNPQKMWDFLSEFTQFHDRGNYTEDGIAAAYWLKTQMETLVKNSGRKDISVFTVETKGFEWENKNSPFESKQPSVIMKIGSSQEPGIVVGAHLDSATDTRGPMQGADDDGSGTAVVMEVARTLVNTEIRFKKPIYLMLYAAEEEGDWGSQAVVQDFKKKNIPIEAVMQLDQVGYARKNDRSIYLVSDKYIEQGSHAHSDHDLTNFLAKMITHYVKQAAVLSCGGLSNDMIWADYSDAKVVRPLETDYCKHRNPNPHTLNDTMSTLSLAHMTNFLKTALAFVVELAEPIASK